MRAALTASRLALGRAHLLGATLVHTIRRAALPVTLIVSVGSARRYAPDVGDVTLLAVAQAGRQAAVLDGCAALAGVAVIDRTGTALTATTDRGRVTIHVATPEQAGAALVWHTGSRDHTRRLQVRAAQFGLRFEDGRLERVDGRPCSVPTEAAFYRRINLPCIPPELREGHEALDAAERRALPSLVTLHDIRGDLHTHTNWSDGRDTIEAVAGAAQQLGYEYVAITDHSERSWASRRLRADDVLRQREAIETVRAQMPGIGILHGVEVDILHDGALDFTDAQLAGFDIVLASLHDHGGHDAGRLMERYLTAVRHPLVNVITHPANRVPAISAGYPLDFDRLFEAAAETGTAVEVDGAPGHLDLDGPLARRAVRAGAMLAIDSDSHRADALGRQMRFGVGTARRGWVEPEHVLNTRSLEEVRAFVARKRTG
jgi:DNA polymerase (family X)